MPTDRKTDALFEKAFADLKAQVDAAYERGREDGIVEGFERAMAALARAAPRPPAGHSLKAEGGTYTIAGFPLASVEKTMPRGMNKLIVEEILRSVAPTALTAKAIAKIAEEKGQGELASTSVNRDIKRLIKEGLVERIGDTAAVRYITKLRAIER